MSESLFESRAQPTGNERYVRVVVERGIEHRKPGGIESLTYRDDTGDLGVGERVEVPLGRGDATSGGVVVMAGGNELLDGLSPQRVKAVLRRRGGRIQESLVELARWIAEYYVCPLGVALAALTPAAVKRETGTKERVLLRPSEGEIDLAKETKGVRAAWEAVKRVEESAWPMDARELAGVLHLKSTRAIARLLEIGAFSPSNERFVEARQPIPGERDLKPEVLSMAEAAAWGRVIPTPAQQGVIEGIERDGASAGRFGVHLLWGVTGSGKTEVYLRLIRGVIERGKTAIVLVPEIALTPQTSARFQERFSSVGVAVLHSGLTAAQRNQEWQKAASGRARVVVGARSALFAPMANLGLIVVDEEHDTSYKQDQAPRYNARDATVKRGQIEDCPVVLGSATPSIESWNNAHARDRHPAKFRLWRLTERVGGAVLPRVETVDLIAERRARMQMGDRSQRLLGPTLEHAITTTLAARHQVILLLNRRGFGSYIYCPNTSCGFVLTCDQCTATLVYHKDRLNPRGGMVRCHHCQSEQLLPTQCPTCKGKLAMFSGGTQRAEEEIERTFADHGIVRGETMLRLDSDTMRTGRDYYRALDRFAKGEVRMLVGTQMVAKGLDFPGVHLVGVIDGDTSAILADFRSDERTFQLINQVAGRAGRGATPGRVIVQTVNPDARPIILAASHDYEQFARVELDIRLRYGLPPTRRMARIVCRDKDAGKSREHAAALARALRESNVSTLEVRGPQECLMARIGGYYRFEVQVLASSAGAVQLALSHVRGRGMLTSDAKTAVDVDPVTMM